MRPEPVSQSRFQRAFASAKARTEEAARECAARPTPEAVHEARIAVRKLTAAVSLMPKGFRRDRMTVKAMKTVRLFYDACAKLRDVDAVMSAFSDEASPGDLSEVVSGLKKRRSMLVAGVMSSAKEVGTLALPRPTDDSRRRLRRRLSKLLDERAEKVSGLYSVAESGEGNVAELHRLRKECRHVMYLLDFADEDMRVKSAKADLEKAREKLGSIRDDDLLLELLNGFRTDVAVKFAASVSARRLAKYRGFFSNQTTSGKKPELLDDIRRLT